MTEKTLYVSRKIVAAVPTARNETVGQELTYKDGYVSFCPQETFDKDYVQIGTFADSPEVPAPTGDNFVVRLMGELAYLQRDNAALGTFISSSNIDKLPVEDQLLLKQQFVLQTELIDVLEKRRDRLVAAGQVIGVITHQLTS